MRSDGPSTPVGNSRLPTVSAQLPTPNCQPPNSQCGDVKSASTSAFGVWNLEVGVFGVWSFLEVGSWELGVQKKTAGTCVPADERPAGRRPQAQHGVVGWSGFRRTPLRGQLRAGAISRSLSATRWNHAP